MDDDAGRGNRGLRRALMTPVQLTALHLSVRLAVSALLLPLAGVILGLALQWSGDPALTDQEIAGLLLSPVGACWRARRGRGAGHRGDPRHRAHDVRCGAGRCRVSGRR